MKGVKGVMMGDPMEAYLSQAWSIQGQLPLLIGIAALLGLGKGGVPGFATVATAATVATSPQHIPGGLGLAVALQVPILTMIDISAVWLHAKDLDFETIKVLLPMSFLGMGLGQWLDQHLSDSNARLLVGIFLLLILSVQIGKDKIMARVEDSKLLQSTNVLNNGGDVEEALVHGEIVDQRPSSLSRRRGANNTVAAKSNIIDDPSVANVGSKKARVILSARTRIIWACVVGIVGGAATMLTNAMGPILNVYLLSVVKLPPTAYIGTRAMFFCFLNCGKLPMRFLAGTLGLKMLPLAGFLGVVSVIGVIGAKPIMLSMSETSFVRLELAVVAFSGIRLCWMGLLGS